MLKLGSSFAAFCGAEAPPLPSWKPAFTVGAGEQQLPPFGRNDKAVSGRVSAAEELPLFPL